MHSCPERTTWQDALLRFVVRTQEPDWCHRVGITSSQERSGGYSLCKALIPHAKNVLQLFNHKSHLGASYQLLLTLVRGALYLPFFVASWRSCLVSLTTWAGYDKCLSQYCKSFSAIQPWQGCKGHGNNPNLTASHMLWTRHDATIWCAWKSLAWHTPWVAHPDHF